MKVKKDKWGNVQMANDENTIQVQIGFPGVWLFIVFIVSIGLLIWIHL